MKTLEQYSYNQFDSIGKGYSSQVFKGKHDLTNENVAIKIIDLKFIKGEIHRKLLQNQICILKSLKDQQNIIQLYDVYNTKANTCIVTQLCDQDLSKTIKTRKTLCENDALNVLKQILNGYKSLHFNDIIHRDLKPANIFWTNGKIKIADFGFAVKNNEIKKKESYNVGSPVYMPYQALSDNMYSFKSDIWAIGVIFYEMLTGRTPWRAKTESDLKKMLKTTTIKELLPSKISKISEQFLLKSLEFLPQNRMSGNQVCNFFERNRNDLQMSIDPRKTLSSTTKYNSFRTRAASQDSQIRHPVKDSLLNNNIFGPKTYKKINILKGVGEQTTYQTKFLKTRATIKDKSDGSFEIDPKKISNQLVSQLHFCRFLFKLIERISKSELVDKTQMLRRQMTSMIYAKLDGIKSLSLLDNQTATEFRMCSEFVKLYKITDQYIEKYRRTLAPVLQKWPADETLAGQIRGLYGYVVQHALNPEQVRQEVILLDYLITLKQLISLNEKIGVEEFAKRSKIEQIVEGKPTNIITKEHVTAINAKIKAMKIA